MLTEEQAFWAMMVLAPVLVLICVFYRQLEYPVRLLGFSTDAELPGVFWLRVVGISLGIIVTISTPLIRWWLL